MNFNTTHHATPRLQTIIACLRESHTTGSARANGEPLVPATTTRIRIQLASVSIFELQIKHPEKDMKTKILPWVASPFLAAVVLAGCECHSEDHPPPAGH
jgi:hypothetical protein